MLKVDQERIMRRESEGGGGGTTGHVETINVALL